MSQFIMNHGVSGCFVTNLAPDASVSPDHVEPSWADTILSMRVPASKENSEQSKTTPMPRRSGRLVSPRRRSKASQFM